MRKLSHAFLFSLFLCAVSVAADAPLLPDQAGAWKAITSAQVAKADELADLLGASPQQDSILRESGLKSGEVRVYKNGDSQMKVHAYLFKDPSGAYEAFTFWMSPRAVDPLETRIVTGSALVQQVGNLVVVYSFLSTGNPESVADFTKALRAKADRTPLPSLRAYLPEPALVNGSEKYALGPEAFKAGLATLEQNGYAGLTRVAGFEDQAEAMIARYDSGAKKGVLLLIEYPTPQLAEQHLHHLEGELPETARKNGVNIERKASLLSVVLDPASQNYANELRQGINYETQVTWNEGSHVATEPPLVVMIVKIFTFTGFFLAVATGLGLLFGIARIFIKRYYPGRVFDRKNDIEVLQMGLSGKKIDSSDMY